MVDEKKRQQQLAELEGIDFTEAKTVLPPGACATCGGEGQERYIDSKAPDAESVRTCVDCVGTGKATVWGYNGSENPETWTGMCATREEAIKEARGEFGVEGFWIIWGTKQEAKTFLPAVEWLIDDMSQRAGDTLGEVAEDWPDVTEEAKEELTKLLEAWCDKHVTCEKWLADGTAEYIEPLPADGGVR